MTTFIVRPFRWDDLPALVDMLNTTAAYDQDGFYYTLDNMRHMLQQRNPEADVFVAITTEGQLIGFVDTIFNSDYGEWAWGSVHPDYRRQGIGTQLLRAADAYVRSQQAASAMIDRIIDSANIGALRLLEAESYVALRDHFEMHIMLDQPLEAPDFPAGISLRSYVHERDGRAVWAAHQAAFRDHWGHIETSYETWEQAKIHDSRYDPSLWLIAVAGDEVAGLAICRRWDARQADLGHVDELAVSRHFRKRGLGLALLQQAFHVLQARGFTHARLGVDAESHSNAVALYERAGMHIRRRYIIYRKTYSTTAHPLPGADQLQ
jgi:mycothiol synthase